MSPVSNTIFSDNKFGVNRGTPPRTKDLRTGTYQERYQVGYPTDTNHHNYSSSINQSGQKATIQDILNPPNYGHNTSVNHPLDNNSNQNYYLSSSNAKNPFHSVQVNSQPYQQEPLNDTNHNYYDGGRRIIAERTIVPKQRSVSRFDLDENRAHNPNENSGSTAAVKRYESSPQRSVVKKGKTSFFEKILQREYKGVLANKNEAKGFDRYISDCKSHVDTAIELQSMQKSWNMTPPIPIIIPDNSKSKNYNFFNFQVLNYFYWTWMRLWSILSSTRKEETTILLQTSVVRKATQKR